MDLASFVIFVALVLVFTWLSSRPGNALVYYPSLLLRGLDPWEGRGRGARSPVGWLRQALAASDSDVVAAGGVDAAVYLVFLSSVLLPVAATDNDLERAIGMKNGKTPQNFTELERLALGNVQLDRRQDSGQTGDIKTVRAPWTSDSPTSMFRI